MLERRLQRINTPVGKASNPGPRIENPFCRLKDFRRIATRYDRLARNFLASICLVAAIVWWIFMSLDPSDVV